MTQYLRIPNGYKKARKLIKAIFAETVRIEKLTFFGKARLFQINGEIFLQKSDFTKTKIAFTTALETAKNTNMTTLERNKQLYVCSRDAVDTLELSIQFDLQRLDDIIMRDKMNNACCVVC